MVSVFSATIKTLVAHGFYEAHVYIASSKFILLFVSGLCSKTYFGAGDDEKLTCKGMQKSRNAFTFEDYKNVLLTGVSGTGTNMGFRSMNGHMYTYTQDKHGLSYFYPKRKVLDDGITTTHLDL